MKDQDHYPDENSNDPSEILGKFLVEDQEFPNSALEISKVLTDSRLDGHANRVSELVHQFTAKNTNIQSTYLDEIRRVVKHAVVKIRKNKKPARIPFLYKISISTWTDCLMVFLATVITPLALIFLLGSTPHKMIIGSSILAPIISGKSVPQEITAFLVSNILSQFSIAFAMGYFFCWLFDKSRNFSWYYTSLTVITVLVTVSTLLRSGNESSFTENNLSENLRDQLHIRNFQLAGDTIPGRRCLQLNFSLEKYDAKSFPSSAKVKIVPYVNGFQTERSEHTLSQDDLQNGSVFLTFNFPEAVDSRDEFFNLTYELTIHMEGYGTVYNYTTIRQGIIGDRIYIDLKKGEYNVFQQLLKVYLRTSSLESCNDLQKPRSEKL